MITLKTRTKFQVPFGRTVRTEFVYLTIERLDIDINNVTPIGFYYFIDETGMVNKLDDIVRSPVLWENIEYAEGGFIPDTPALPGLESSVHLKDNLLQRLLEFTLIKIEQEGNSNYGTIKTDWEVLV